ncbi:Uncharacterised protein [uncultured archaeon]|nr:Uncharacterised protein [uncultured archaeon]
MITEGILCKTCKELDVEIIEFAVNPDHPYIFQIPTEVFAQFYRKEAERTDKQDTEERVSPSQGVLW